MNLVRSQSPLTAGASPSTAEDLRTRPAALESAAAAAPSRRRDEIDDRAIARWRLHTQRLSGHRYPSPEAVVDGLLAVQAENHAQAAWAVAARTSGTTHETFARLFDDGAILRTHVLRPTWHFVRPTEIRWLLELTAPRIRRLVTTQQRQLELDDGMLEHAREVIVEALHGAVQLTRDALARRLRAAGLPAEGQRLGLMLADAELAALICSGAMQGRLHTYALLDERAPDVRRLDRDEALTELATRYFTGHGPATERDLAYWATMPLTDVRRGLAQAEAAGKLDRFEHDGRSFWFGEPPPAPEVPLQPRALLLQILDEYHHGYQDSRHVLDVDGIVPGGRATTMGMALVVGQMVAGMRRAVDAERVTFEIERFRALDDGELAALQEAAERYAAFLGVGAATVRFTGRDATSVRGEAEVQTTTTTEIEP